jgi:hypothetical protein
LELLLNTGHPVLLVHKVQELKMHLDPVTIAPVSNAGLSNHFHGKEVLKLK